MTKKKIKSSRKRMANRKAQKPAAGVPISAKRVGLLGTASQSLMATTKSGLKKLLAKFTGKRG